MKPIRTVVHRPDMSVPITYIGGAADGSAGEPPAAEMVVTPKEPTLVELATNFAGAMAKWSARGWPTVDQAGYDARAAECAVCIHPDGRPMAIIAHTVPGRSSRG